MGRNGAQTLHWLDKKLTTESSHMKVFYLLFRIFTDISPYAIWLYLFCNQTVPLTTLFLDKSSIKWISLEPAEAITLSEKVELKKKVFLERQVSVLQGFHAVATSHISVQ